MIVQRRRKPRCNQHHTHTPSFAAVPLGAVPLTLRVALDGPGTLGGMPAGCQKCRGRRIWLMRSITSVQP